VLCTLPSAKASDGSRASPSAGGRGGRAGKLVVFIAAMDGSPAIACPGTCKDVYVLADAPCAASALGWIGSHGTEPLNRIYQGARSTLHPPANYRWLPAAAACFYFGSRVAACGIHATVDEENRPGRPMRS
jgi:hypothetical protein